MRTRFHRKFLRLLLASITLNVILLAGLYILRSKTEQSRSLILPVPKKEYHQNLHSLLSADDIGKLLKEHQFPDSVIQSIVIQKISEKYRTRRSEFVLARTRSTPWWKDNRIKQGAMGLLSTDERSALRVLESEMRAEVLTLFGPGALDRDGRIAFRFNFLSPEKAVALDALRQDYRDMSRDVREEAGSAITESDRKKLNLLTAEEDQDIRAMMSSGEFQQYRLRASETAQKLAKRIRAFNPSLGEHEALFDTVELYYENFRNRPGPNGISYSSGPIDENKEYSELIRRTLGETRYRQWEIAGHEFSQKLASRAAYLGLLPDAVKSVNAWIYSAMEESDAIVSSTLLNDLQRHDRLIQLAHLTKEKVRIGVGSQNADEILDGNLWFQTIIKGQPVKMLKRTR